MMQNRRFGVLVVVTALLISGPVPRMSAATLRVDALVLVNSASASYVDFQYYVQAYLDNFGVPYTVLDIAAESVNANVSEYAVIIVGHRELDADGVYLDTTEQANISAAVSAGTGIVNFDNDLSADGSSARYLFVQDIFGFGYVDPPEASGVTFIVPAEPSGRYITACHETGEFIGTSSMTLAGITLPEDVTALASSGSQPFLAVTTSGDGRAVQWGTYDWMSHLVKGPVYGLDDLVWRSIVWAARKPFVMQCMPPFVTMRVDDDDGPFDWIHIANEFDIKPWTGIFLDEIDEIEAADLSALVQAGLATTSIHARSYYDSFYTYNWSGYRKDLYWFLSYGSIGATLAGPGGTPGRDWLPNVPIEAGAWTHVALTYDGSSMVMYKNGVDVASTSASGDLMLADPSSDEPFLIGRNTEWGEYFDGVIDEVRLYNRALDASEVEGLYQSDNVPPLPPANLATTGQTENSITLTWDAPPAAEDGDLASAYRLFRDGTLVGQSSGTTFEDMGLAGGTCYNYEVYSVDDAGNASLSAASGAFCTTVDTVAPGIVSVMASSETSVEVVFSESLDQASAENVDNYAISDGISITSASLGADLITVTLATSAHTEALVYTLTVANVEDLAGNPIPETFVAYQYFAPSDLVLDMRFDEAGGTIAADSSGNGNDGTLVNGPSWTAGQVNGGLSFDGSNDYVEVADDPSFDIASEITVTAWINPTDASDWRTIVSKLAGNRKDVYWFLRKGKIGAALAGPSGVPGRDWQPNVPIEINTWTHVALTYDGATMIMYKDGAPAASTSASGALMLADSSSNESCLVGANTQWGEHFHGIIDELQVYNRALSASEIGGLYQLDDTPPLPPTNLVSTSQTESSISLAWDAPPAAEDGDLASAYGIFRDGTQVGQTSNTTFEDTGLGGGTCYNYEVYSVDDAGNASTSAASGTFCTTADTMAPTIVSVTAFSETSVEIVFSESLDQASAENVDNYAISDGISITSASLGSDLIRVMLATSAHTEALVYTLTVANVEDLAGNPMLETSADYQYLGPSDLVLDMRFDEGAGETAFDSSGNGNDGTLLNGPTWASGQVNGALSFDGSNDYVEVADDPSFDIASEITVTAWINPTNASDWRTIVSKFAGNRKDVYWFLRKGKIGAALAGPSGVPGRDWRPDVLIATGVWTHVALTYDGATMIMYKNGVNAASTSVSGELMLADSSSNESLFVGANTQWGEHFYGIIDELRVYSRTLSASEIAGLYQPEGMSQLATGTLVSDKGRYALGKANDAASAAEGGGMASAGRALLEGDDGSQADGSILGDAAITGLVGYWKLDETGGTSASDSSGNENIGMLTNMDPATSWVAGKVGGALDFDGFNDYVQVADSASFDIASGITISAWINPADASDWRTIASKFAHTSSQVAANFADGTEWHNDHGIQISKFVAPHFYELSVDAFAGLDGWGMESVGTVIEVGTAYGSPWLVGGPYHLDEQSETSRTARPVHYADFLTVPWRPEFDGQFFNCITEIRDDAGYEWYPDNDVSGSIGRGTRQLRRAFDSMVLATLFAHKQYVETISPTNWRAILQGIKDNIASYEPQYVTMDHACRYVRAMYTSDITASTYDPNSRQVTTTLEGHTDLPTMLYLFTEEGGLVQDVLVEVPTFSGSTEVVYQLGAPSTVDHFTFDAIASPQLAGTAFPIAITARDTSGNLLANYSGQASLSDSTGSISPPVTGNFSAGVWSGVVTIGQTGSGVTINASDGVATGTSNSFDVVSVPDIIQINCWEDQHQDPVLATTSDAGELSAVDGQWTELLYTRIRDYPTIMAGADEESYGLAVMRFYAVGIPTGQYEVLANLYTETSGRDMRYYYGYAAGSPKASFVDTVGGAGGTDQHEEYSLGTVNITDGTFNIYVQDADLLSGTYPFFGWAWIRLMPVSMVGGQ